ncbi:hypothetical protein JCM12294_24340 [Desulfocicer niacini]
MIIKGMTFDLYLIETQKVIIKRNAIYSCTTPKRLNFKIKVAIDMI